MNCASIVLFALMYASLAEAKWCLQNVTIQIPTMNVHTKTVFTPATWYGPAVEQTVTYQKIEQVPHVKLMRVCCDGYTLDESVQNCIPVCANECPKMAECVEPNICQCSPGYTLQEGMCQLDADNCTNCENGKCTDSGVCQCNAMYVRIEDTCKPICRQKCTNGFCAAPDVCQCSIGFQENAETNSCEPICTKSCGGNAYCASPDVCICKYGFFGNAHELCLPWCKSECKNGQCIGPNNCDCHQGFIKDGGLCIPDCQGCKFGDCLDTGVCECWPDFVYNNATRSCEEFVEIPKQEIPTHSDHMNCVEGECFCVDGFTQVDDSCALICNTCQLGDCVNSTLCQKSSKMEMAPPPTTEKEFTSTSESSTSESSTTSVATEPTTDCGCWAGICVNGICQCPDGLILNNENECIMPCEATCKHGVCTQDNVCQCPPGFEYKNGNECVPHCEEECINSFCIEPNHCECLEGYTPQTSSAFACLPTCNTDSDEGCINGTCVAVNKCACLEGFVPMPGNRFKCLPSAQKYSGDSFWIIYLILGLLILFVVSVFGFYAIRKMQYGSYNVDKVEQSRGTVRYKNNDQPYCSI